MNAKVFLDNTILTNYALAQRFDLLGMLWKENLYVPQEVANEYIIGVKAALVPENVVSHLPIIQLTEEERLYAETFSNRLGAGERACLAACSYREGAFASDDRDARVRAQQLTIPVIGSVGILVLCVRKQMLAVDDAQKLLDIMIAFGYRSPITEIAVLANRKK